MRSLICLTVVALLATRAEAAGPWQSGTASLYAGLAATGPSAGGSCGLGSVSSSWIGQNVVSASSLNLAASYCGACLQVVCKDLACTDSAPFTVLVTDSCTDCTAAELELPSFAFASNLGPGKATSVTVAYRQVPCQPPGDITVRVTSLAPSTTGATITLGLLGVAGSGLVTSVGIKSSKATAWTPMGKTSVSMRSWSAVVPGAAPYDLQVTSQGTTLLLPGVITAAKVADYASKAQFKVAAADLPGPVAGAPVSVAVPAVAPAMQPVPVPAVAPAVLPSIPGAAPAMAPAVAPAAPVKAVVTASVPAAAPLPGSYALAPGAGVIPSAPAPAAAVSRIKFPSVALGGTVLKPSTISASAPAPATSTVSTVAKAGVLKSVINLSGTGILPLTATKLAIVQQTAETLLIGVPYTALTVTLATTAATAPAPAPAAATSKATTVPKVLPAAGRRLLQTAATAPAATDSVPLQLSVSTSSLSMAQQVLTSSVSTGLFPQRLTSAGIPVSTMTIQYTNPASSAVVSSAGSASSSGLDPIDLGGSPVDSPPAPSSKTSFPIAAIVGVVIGAIVLLIAGGCIIYAAKKRHKQRVEDARQAALEAQRPKKAHRSKGSFGSERSYVSTRSARSGAPLPYGQYREQRISSIRDALALGADATVDINATTLPIPEDGLGLPYRSMPPKSPGSIRSEKSESRRSERSERSERHSERSHRHHRSGSGGEGRSHRHHHRSSSSHSRSSTKTPSPERVPRTSIP